MVRQGSRLQNWKSNQLATACLPWTFCSMSGLFQTARGALTDWDALDPVCSVTTTKDWNGAGGDQGGFKMQIIRHYRENRHLSEAEPMEKTSSS